MEDFANPVATGGLVGVIIVLAEIIKNKQHQKNNGHLPRIEARTAALDARHAEHCIRCDGQNNKCDAAHAQSTKEHEAIIAALKDISKGARQWSRYNERLLVRMGLTENTSPGADLFEEND